MSRCPGVPATALGINCCLSDNLSCVLGRLSCPLSTCPSIFPDTPWRILWFQRCATGMHTQGQVCPLLGHYVWLHPDFPRLAGKEERRTSFGECHLQPIQCASLVRFGMRLVQGCVPGMGLLRGRCVGVVLVPSSCLLPTQPLWIMEHQGLDNPGGSCKLLLEL